MLDNSEEEKRLLVLLVILELGGRSTKGAVLDRIYSEGYIDLAPKDLEIMASRDEEVWRNNIAYVRHHLVQEGYMDGSQKDNWEITPKGKQYFLNQVEDIITSANIIRTQAQAAL